VGLNPYTTARKVFAEGVRVGETPLPVRTFADVNGEGKIDTCGSTPPTRKARRRMYRRLNFGSVPGFAPICMDSNDNQTVESAFASRLMRKVPEADPEKLARLKVFVKNFLHKYVSRVTPYEFEEWLASTTYTEQRKMQLREVHQSLRGGRPTRRQASHIDTFVKSEFYPTWKQARMINSRCDAFKVWSGPMFKAIEDEVYRIKSFIKHVPVPERPALISGLRQAGAFYYATDYTAFESHFVPEVMRALEIQLYKHCLGAGPDTRFLCRTLLGKNRMRTRNGIRAEVPARRMSGDMCTSLGNGFSNLMLTLFIAHEKGGSVEGFVEGDDGIFRSSVPLEASDYEALGFTIKIERVTDPCAASFCGMVFADSGEIIRDPRRFLAGFGWTQSFLYAGDRIMGELLRAKALSAVYETPQCPIVGALARAALSETRMYTPRFVDDGYHKIPHDESDTPAFSPRADTRELFSRLYGIPVLAQLEIERLIDQHRFDRIQSLLWPDGAMQSYSENYIVIT